MGVRQYRIKPDDALGYAVQTRQQYQVFGLSFCGLWRTLQNYYWFGDYFTDCSFESPEDANNWIDQQIERGKQKRLHMQTAPKVRRIIS